MSGKCKVCLKAVKTSQVKIKCNDCESLCHGACVNMSQNDIDFLLNSGDVFRCEQCKQERRTSMRVETELNKGEINSKVIYDLLLEMRNESKKQIKDLENELGKSLEMCHQDNTALKSKLEEQSVLLKKFESNYNMIKQENEQLSNKIKSLEAYIDDMEQYSRANCLEINGVIEESNEDIIGVVKKIGETLGVQIDSNGIDACHRLGAKRSDRTRGIIVKFTRRVIKDEILSKRRARRNFNTKDIGITDRPADVIYINENLTQARKRVFNAAREMKRKDMLKYVWVRNGKVLVRADEGERVVVLSTMEQVAKLESALSTRQPSHGEPQVSEEKTAK